MLSAMIAPGAGMPVEKLEIDQLWTENRDLKKDIGNLREAYSQLEFECDFNRIKATELQDILQLRSITGGESDLQEKLIVKTLLNVELNMEVAKLNQELEKANSCVLDLGKERDSSKRMLLELADIVRTLQAVQVDYESTSRETSYLGSQYGSIRNIKKKVEAMIEERKSLISKCGKLESENRQKSQMVLALEAQFHLLNSTNISKGSTDISDTSITTDLTESVTGSISRCPTEDTHNVSDENPSQRPSLPLQRNQAKMTAGLHDIHTQADKQKAPKASQDEVSCASTAPESVSSAITSVNVKKVTIVEDSEEVARLQTELDSEKLKYERFKQVCQGAFSKMSEVEDDLEKTKDALIATIKKRDVYKETLREVINHYKELHGEHSDALDKIESLEDELQMITDDNVQLQNEMVRIEEQKKELLQIRKDAKEQMLIAEGIYMPEDKDDADDALVEAYRRSEERIKTLERKLEVAKREAGASADNKTVADRRLRDAIQKNLNLEQEKEILEDRVARANEDCQLSKKEAHRQREAAKHTRRRLAAYAQKIKKLETGQLLVTDAIAETSKMDHVDFDGILHRMLLVEMNVAVKAWAEKKKLMRERDELDKENDELKAFCEDVLNEVSTTAKKEALVRAKY